MLDATNLNEQIFVGTSKAADLCDVSRSTVHRWMQMDGFPVVRVGGRALIPVTELVAWVKAGGRATNA